jgi:hypothetical protein
MGLINIYNLKIMIFILANSKEIGKLIRNKISKE